MTGFKEMVERAIADRNRISRRNSPATQISNDYKEKFGSLIGEPIIWKTRNNTNIKAPQLVVVENTYENFVTVVKTSMGVDGVENKIRYAIQYAALYANLDSFETLEFT